MSKVHITLVGGQIVPVSQGIEHLSSKPDTIVLVCSETSEAEISNVKLPKDTDIVKLTFDVTDMDAIKRETKECYEQYKDDEVTINITGGPKAWAIYLLIEFSVHKDATIFIIDQNGTVHDIIGSSGKPGQIRSRSIKEHLSLTGPQPDQHGTPMEYNNSEDVAVIDAMEDLRINYQPLIREFTTLCQSLSKTKHKVATSDDGASTIECGRGGTVTIDLNHDGYRYYNELKSPHVRPLVLNAGWFEIKVARMLRKWDKCNEIWTNCIFRSSNITPNELDIIANLGVKLLFVECKTQIHNPTDIDKFNSVVKKYGGNGHKKLFITYEKMNDTNRETCMKYGIIPFSINDEPDHAEERLISILESELPKSNL